MDFIGDQNSKPDISALSASTLSSTSTNAPPPRLASFYSYTTAYASEPGTATNIITSAYALRSAGFQLCNPTDTKGKISTGLRHPSQHPFKYSPPQPQSNHRVSFSIPAPQITHSCRSSQAGGRRRQRLIRFNSNNDAFFALADLGPPVGNDADIGRPIEANGNQPIDQDEGLLRKLDEDDDDVPPANHSGQDSNTKPTPPSRSDPNATKSRRELIAAALGGGVQTISRTTPPMHRLRSPQLLLLSGGGNVIETFASTGSAECYVQARAQALCDLLPASKSNPHPSLAPQNHQ